MLADAVLKSPHGVTPAPCRYARLQWIEPDKGKSHPGVVPFFDRQFYTDSTLKRDNFGFFCRPIRGTLCR